MKRARFAHCIPHCAKPNILQRCTKTGRQPACAQQCRFVSKRFEVSNFHEFQKPAHRGRTVLAATLRRAAPDTLAVLASSSALGASAAVCSIPIYLAFVASLRSIAAWLGIAQWPDLPNARDWLGSWSDTARELTAPHHAGAWGSSCMVVLISLFLGMTADYAFGTRPFRGRLPTLAALGAALLPQVATLAIVFDLARVGRVYNHWWALSTPYLVFTLPFVVWAVLALAGGCVGPAGRWRPWPAGRGRRLMRRVLWPAAAPALLASGAMAFVGAWNEFMFALTAVTDATQRAQPQSIDLAPATDPLWCGGLALSAVACALLASGRRWRFNPLGRRA